MEKLIEWVNQTIENKTIHPLLIIAVFVVCFLAIHPFADGNGRLVADFDDFAFAAVRL